MDAALARLAERERAKMQRQPKHRSSKQTLLRFTGSNVSLNFDSRKPTHPLDLMTPVTRMISRRFGGDRLAAERECLAQFEAATGSLSRLASGARPFVLEMALVAQANGITDSAGLAILRRQAECRPKDLFRYQKGWFEFFAWRNGVPRTPTVEKAG